MSKTYTNDPIRTVNEMIAEAAAVYDPELYENASEDVKEKIRERQRYDDLIFDATFFNL